MPAPTLTLTHSLTLLKINQMFDFEITISVHYDSTSHMSISTSVTPEGTVPEEVDKAIKSLYTNVNLKMKKNEDN